MGHGNTSAPTKPFFLPPTPAKVLGTREQSLLRKIFAAMRELVDSSLSDEIHKKKSPPLFNSQLNNEIQRRSFETTRRRGPVSVPGNEGGAARRGEERRTLEKDLRPRFRAAEIGPRVLARFCGSNISTGLPRNGRTHRQLVRKWLTSLLRVFRPAFHELTVLSAPGSTLPPACHRGLKILPFFSINRPTRKRESVYRSNIVGRAIFVYHSR